MRARNGANLRVVALQNFRAGLAQQRVRQVAAQGAARHAHRVKRDRHTGRFRRLGTRQNGGAARVCDVADVYAERSRYARDFLHLVGMLRHDRLSAHGEDPVRTVVDRNRIRDAVDERRCLAQIISRFAQRVLQLWCHRPSPPNHAGILQAVRCGAVP